MKYFERAPLEKAVCIGYALMMALILGVCLFGNNIDYSGKTQILFAEPLLLCCGILIIGGLAVGLNWLFRHIPKNEKAEERILLFLSMLLLIFQAYCVWNYYFMTGWDVSVIMKAAEAVAHGKNLEDFQYYFSTYPNNLLIVWLYGILIRFFDLVRVDYRIGILFFQCVLSWGTGLFLFDTARQITNSRFAAWLSWILYLILVGVSPWVSIPYSDSTGLIFPVAIFWCYVKMEKEESNKKWLYGGAIGLLTAIGYRIKPQIFIVLIAIGIVYVIHALKDLKQTVKTFGNILIGLIIAMLLVSTCIRSTHIKIDTDRTYGITHFLMMGMNYYEGGGNGTWNADDVEFSGSFSTAKERRDANLQIAGERIKEMGVPGMVHLMRRKILTNYNDGTFCWAGEGNFFIELLSKADSPFAEFLRTIYYTRSWDRHGYQWFNNFELMIWLTILFAGIFSVFQKENRRWTSVIMLAVIGLTVFELLFEARARYLYTYTPLYILLAVAGIQKIMRRKQVI